MGVAYARDGSVFTIACEGTYAAEDMIHVFDAILAAEDFPTTAHLLLDMRRSTSVLDRPIQEMRRVARHFTANAQRFQGRLAIVAEGAARYGLMRMAAVWAEFEGCAVHVSLDRDEALRWLLSSEAASA